MYRLIIISLLLSNAVFGQKKKDRDTSSLITQPNRVEFEVGKRTGDFTVINGGDDGLGVVIENYNKYDKKHEWFFVKLDSELQESWRTTFLVNLSATMLGYEYFDGKYYVMVSASPYRTEEMVVYEIDAEGNVEEFEITTVFPITLDYFEVIGETMIIAGSVNGKPAIITYNVIERKPKVLPGFYENRNEILDIVIDDQELMFTVVLREKMQNKLFTTRARTFTAEGLLVQDIIVEAGERRNLIDASSTTFDNGLQMMAGAHSRKNSSFSKGLYLAKFVNGRQQFIQYNNYADLENFFGYLKGKKEQRIKKRIEKRKALGKKNKFNYRLLVHEMIQRQDGVNILLGEAYYPRYSNSSAYTNPYYGFGRGGSGFLGYKFTHAIVVAFDNNGKMLWDHSFEISDVLTYSLDPLVSVSAFDDQIVLMYLEENEIRSKIVKNNEVVEGQTFNPPKLNNENDEVRSRDPEIEELEYWFDKSFIGFGIHNVAPQSGAVFKTSRKVFYINKIQYDEARLSN